MQTDDTNGMRDNTERGTEKDFMTYDDMKKHICGVLPINTNIHLSGYKHFEFREGIGLLAFGCPLKIKYTMHHS